jgi:hypothetical protein
LKGKYARSHFGSSSGKALTLRVYCTNKKLLKFVDVSQSTGSGEGLRNVTAQPSVNTENAFVSK